MMEKSAKIYVAGHRGMVGSAIVRELERQGYTNIVTCTHKELDLWSAGCCGSSLKKRSRNMFSWQLRRWAALWPTRMHWLILCMII